MQVTGLATSLQPVEKPVVTAWCRSMPCQCSPVHATCQVEGARHPLHVGCGCARWALADRAVGAAQHKDEPHTVLRCRVKHVVKRLRDKRSIGWGATCQATAVERLPTQLATGEGLVRAGGQAIAAGPDTCAMAGHPPSGSIGMSNAHTCNCKAQLPCQGRLPGKQHCQTRRRRVEETPTHLPEAPAGHAPRAHAGQCPLQAPACAPLGTQACIRQTRQGGAAGEGWQVSAWAERDFGAWMGLVAARVEACCWHILSCCTWQHRAAAHPRQCGPPARSGRPIV